MKPMSHGQTLPPVSHSIVKNLWAVFLIAFVGISLRANPLVLDAPFVMIAENVTVRVSEQEANVSGLYRFQGRGSDGLEDKKSYTLELPIFLPDLPVAKLDRLVNDSKALVTIAGRTFHPFRQYGVSRKSPRSAISTYPDNSILVVLLFSIPIEAIQSDFEALITYTQVHVQSPNGMLATYCPMFSPLISDGTDHRDNPHFLVRFVCDVPIAMQRISKNEVIISESSHSLQVRPQNLESIVVKVKRTSD